MNRMGTLAVAGLFALATLPAQTLAGPADAKPNSAKTAKSAKKSKGEKADRGRLLERLSRLEQLPENFDISAAPERMQKALGRADRDGDGKISPDELAQLRERLGSPAERPEPAASQTSTPSQTPAADIARFADQSVSKKEALQTLSALLDRADTDKDGTLTPEEWGMVRAAVAGGGGDSRGGRRLGAGPVAGRLGQFGGGQVFEKLDTNSDGKLSRAELPDRMQGFFAVIDANADDTVDREELQAAMRQVAERMGDRRKAKGGKAAPKSADRPEGIGPRRIFNEQDLNADGTLTRDEAKGKLAEHFESLDADKNGTLDFREVEAGQKKAGGKSD